jgi:hypothetical protein
MSEIRLKKKTVQYNDFKVNFIKIQNKKDVERKISHTLDDISLLIASLLFEMPTKNTLNKLAKKMEPMFLPDNGKYGIELVTSENDTSGGLSSYWTNLGFEAYVKDKENRNRFNFLDYIIMKEKVSEIENWIKL